MGRGVGRWRGFCLFEGLEVPEGPRMRLLRVPYIPVDDLSVSKGALVGGNWSEDEAEEEDVLTAVVETERPM